MNKQTTFDVMCLCGMVHRLLVDDSALCQCGRVVSIRRDGQLITPWNGEFDLRGNILSDYDFADRVFYKSQPTCE